MCGSAECLVKLSSYSFYKTATDTKVFKALKTLRLLHSIVGGKRAESTILQLVRCSVIGYCFMFERNDVLGSSSLVSYNKGELGGGWYLACDQIRLKKD